MRVLVFEAGYLGHRLTYLRLMLSAICRLADDVTVALPLDAPQTLQYRTQLASLEGQFHLDAWMPPVAPTLLANALQTARMLLESIRRCNADYVFVPSADGLAQALGLMHRLHIARVPPRVELEGLLLRGSFAYKRPGLKRRWAAVAALKAAALGPWSLLHYLDPIPYASIQQRGGSFAQRVRLMPDPVEPPLITDRFAARRFLGIPQDGRYVGSAGVSERRKGSDRLIRAFAEAPLRENDRLLLVGRIDRDLRPMIDNEFAHLVRSGRIIILDRYVTEEELRAGVSAMDLVCTPYPEHIGSASIVIRAAASQRPVLASDFGWMGFVVSHFSLGRTCPVTSPGQLASSLVKALDESADFRLSPAGQRFVQFHAMDNFQAAWTARLRQRLALPPSQTCRTWQWVIGTDQSLSS